MLTQRIVPIVATFLLALPNAESAQQESPPLEHVVEAQKFLLKDEYGTVRAELGFRRGGPHIDLLNSDGSIGVTLNLEDNGRGLAISGPTGKEQLAIGRAPGQVYAITVKSEDGSQLFTVPDLAPKASVGSTDPAPATWPIALAIVIAGMFIAAGVFFGITRKRIAQTCT